MSMIMGPEGPQFGADQGWYAVDAKLNSALAKFIGGSAVNLGKLNAMIPVEASPNFAAGRLGFIVSDVAFTPAGVTFNRSVRVVNLGGGVLFEPPPKNPRTRPDHTCGQCAYVRHNIPLPQDD